MSTQELFSLKMDPKVDVTSAEPFSQFMTQNMPSSLIDPPFLNCIMVHMNLKYVESTFTMM